MSARFAAFARHRQTVVPPVPLEAEGWGTAQTVDTERSVESVPLVPQASESWGTGWGTAQRVATERFVEPVPLVPLVPLGNDVSGNESAPPDETSADIVRLWERVIQREMERGADRPSAEAKSLAQVRGRLMNSPRMMLPDSAANSCAICGGPDTSFSRLLPIMSPEPGRHVWLHAKECHDRYRRGLAAKVGAAMIRAGLPDPREELP